MGRKEKTRNNPRNNKIEVAESDRDAQLIGEFDEHINKLKRESEANIQKTAITKKYTRETKKTLAKYLGIASLGVSLIGGGIGGGVYLHSTNPYREIGERYNAIQESLINLENYRQYHQINSKSIPYRPEHIKPYVEEIFGEEKKHKSLETLTNLLNEDLKKISFEDINNYRERQRGAMTIGFLSGLLGFIICAVCGDIGYSNIKKINNKKKNELRTLEKSM